MKTFDIAVIGAGAGLSKIVAPCAAKGLKVALCEEDRLGGTCLNRGCIPSKMLIHPADLVTMVEEAAPAVGLRFGSRPTIDFQALVQRVSRTVDGDSDDLAKKYDAAPNVTWFKKRVKFVGRKMLSDGETTFTADRIFVCAGSRPVLPVVSGLEGTPYMTSAEALRLESLPKKLLVVGGGYIACELAHFYGSMGSEVQVFVRGNRVLRGTDHEIADHFRKVFASRYRMQMEVGDMSAVDYDKSTGLFHVRFASGCKAVGDGLLLALGVRGNADILDCAAGDLHADPHTGFIHVDNFMRTSVEGVWAFGDIAGRYAFRHSANFEAEYVYESIFGDAAKHPVAIDYTGMPFGVFSYPQVAGVGQTEEQLRKAGIHYVVGISPYSNSGMGMAWQFGHGMVKVLVERTTRKLLGVHVVGHEATTMIHNAIPLFRLHGLLDDLLHMVYVHPSLNEILRNAARRARDALQAQESIPSNLLLK